MVERFEKFSYLISELSKLLHKIESDELSELGVKGPYAIYILTLAKHRDGISASKISELCARDKSDVSRAIGDLIEKKLAARISTDGKKYKAPIALTEKGFLVADRISAKAKSAVEYASAGISDDERKIFYDALETICLNLTKLSLSGLENKDKE